MSKQGITTLETGTDEGQGRCHPGDGFIQIHLIRILHAEVTWIKKKLRRGQNPDFLRLKMVQHQNSWEKDSHPPQKRYSMATCWLVDPEPLGVSWRLLRGIHVRRPQHSRRSHPSLPCVKGIAGDGRHMATPFVVSRNVVLCPDQAPNSSCRVHVLGDPL